MSKGKRSRKRKRKEIKAESTGAVDVQHNEPPPAPEISSHLIVGLSNITRYLEYLSRAIKPKNDSRNGEENSAHTAESYSQPSANPGLQMPKHLAAIFVCRSSQPSVLHAHLPHLIATASLAHSDAPPTRLVQLPQGCENRLCSSLGLPRASFVAVMEDAPHSKSLLDLVRHVVSAVEIRWLKEAQGVQYQPLKVKAIQTTAPIIKSMRDAK